MEIDQIEFFHPDYVDIILHILDFLDDGGKLNLLSLNKFLRSLLNHVTFVNEYDYDKICHLPYYDSFTNIMVHDVDEDTRLPKRAKIVWFVLNYDVPEPKKLDHLVPESVEDLAIEGYFNFTFNIPTRVKKLAFYYLDGNNEEFYQLIPNGVVDLTIKQRTDTSLVGMIPNGVKNLELDIITPSDPNIFPPNLEKLILHCYDNLTQFIPRSVTSLTYDFDGMNRPNLFNLDNVHNGVTYLQLVGYFNGYFMGQFPDSLISLTLGRFFDKNIFDFNFKNIFKISFEPYPKFKGEFQIPKTIKDLQIDGYEKQIVVRGDDLYVSFLGNTTLKIISKVRNEIIDEPQSFINFFWYCLLIYHNHSTEAITKLKISKNFYLQSLFKKNVSDSLVDNACDVFEFCLKNNDNTHAAAFTLEEMENIIINKISIKEKVHYYIKRSLNKIDN